MTQPPTGPPAPQRRRARHLIDFDNPQPAPPARGAMSLTTVQMWILSTLAVSTILHFSAGLIASAVWLADDEPDAQLGLNILAGVTGVIAVAAGLAIHRQKVFSWWLLLGVLPLPIGLFLTFGT